jgi:Nickel responsive protein SCO4226-like
MHELVHCQLQHRKAKTMTATMKRYVIERELPGVGKMNREQLKGAAVTSCDALAKLPGKVQWEHSYVADDKTFCIYLADGEAAIREHARLSGFPASKITEARTIIDPTTASA